MSAVNPIIEIVLDWEGRSIRLSYDPVSWDIIDHLEIHAEGNQPLPITETGYKSHFFGPVTPSLTADEVKDMVRDWLNRQAKSPAWIEAEATRKQPSLF